MADLELVRAAIERGVPYNRELGVRVEVAEDEHAEVVLPARETHLNHVGTIHAAITFAVGEAASGAMAVAALGHWLNQGARPLVTDARIQYRAPARGLLRGQAELPTAERERAERELRETGRAHLTIAVRIVGEDQAQPCAEMQVSWVILGPRSER